MEMVFAQALHLYNSDFSYQFDTEEMKQLNKQQVQEVRINIQELASLYIEPSSRDTEGAVIGTPTDIAKLLFEESGIDSKMTQSDKVKLGQFLSHNGFEHFEGHAGTKKYYYKLKSSEN
jgi:hypothetical protein